MTAVKTVPLSYDYGFYEDRDFNVPNKPLLYTFPRSKLNVLKWSGVENLHGWYAVSIKRDGKFVRAIKKGNLIRMITSNGRDFYHNELASVMQELADGQYNMEMFYRDGLLKSRDKTGYLTTAYTNYRKQDTQAGYWPEDCGLMFEIHDFLPYTGEKGDELTSLTYLQRVDLAYLGLDYYDEDEQTLLRIANHIRFDADNETSYFNLPARLQNDLGYDSKIHEGLVFHALESGYQLPINPHNYKLKNVLECTGTVVDSEFNTDGGIGTLIVAVDRAPSKESICRVSSGINDNIRAMSQQELLGIELEIEYESITAKGEYNQPRIKRWDI